jgi:hypothetical protein
LRGARGGGLRGDCCSHTPSAGGAWSGVGGFSAERRAMFQCFGAA